MLLVSLSFVIGDFGTTNVQLSPGFFPDMTIKMIEKLFLNGTDEEDLTEEDKKLQAQTKANLVLISPTFYAKLFW